MSGLTSAELRALDLTVQLVNIVCQEIIGTGPPRADDVAEFVGHIHAIQHALMAQAAARAHPDQFRLLGYVGAWGGEQ